MNGFRNAYMQKYVLNAAAAVMKRSRRLGEDKDRSRVARVGGKFVFTVAPRTPLLMAMFSVGKLFPRSDRSPVMIPHRALDLASDLRIAGVNGRLAQVERVTSGFYISECLRFGGQP